MKIGSVTKLGLVDKHKFKKKKKDVYMKNYELKLEKKRKGLSKKNTKKMKKAVKVLKSKREEEIERKTTSYFKYNLNNSLVWNLG